MQSRMRARLQVLCLASGAARQPARAMRAAREYFAKMKGLPASSWQKYSGGMGAGPLIVSGRIRARALQRKRLAPAGAQLLHRSQRLQDHPVAGDLDPEPAEIIHPQQRSLHLAVVHPGRKGRVAERAEVARCPASPARCARCHWRSRPGPDKSARSGSMPMRRASSCDSTMLVAPVSAMKRIGVAVDRSAWRSNARPAARGSSTVPRSPLPVGWGIISVRISCHSP